MYCLKKLKLEGRWAGKREDCTTTFVGGFPSRREENGFQKVGRLCGETQCGKESEEETTTVKKKEVSTREDLVL